MTSLFRMTRLLIVCVLAGATAGPLTGCTTNEATGRKQLNLLSRDDEIRLGEQAAPQFSEEGGGPIPNPAIQQYVSDLGLRLAELSERPELPWEFKTLDSAMINAFALPGGKVFVTRGLLGELDNEAQLAGILGHEIGHVTAQHINEQMSQRMVMSVGLIALGAAAQYSDEDWVEILGIGAAAGGSLYLLSFGRDQEYESDMLGLRYMTRLGYDPMAQAQTMQLLAEQSSGRAGLEILQTHPYPGKRADRVRELIAENYPYTQNNPEYGLFADRYQRMVLRRLEDLPPPEHDPQAEAEQTE
jgi:predicted Zn-dependent protease